MKKGALFGADVDECRLDPREDGFDLAEVDVTHRTAGVGTIDQELNKTVVLQDRHAGLPRAAADQNLALQSSYPRSRTGSTRAGAYGYPSNSSKRPEVWAER